MTDLSAIIKAYDVRGTVPDQLNEDVARAIGTAFARVLAERGAGKGEVVVAHDMRESGPGLVAAFADGLRSEGVDVINAGLCSTDQLYYASGILDRPGAMFTASHNPAEYNGIKHCYAGAKPVGQDTGLDRVKEIAQELLDTGATAGELTGGYRERDMLPDYAAHLRDLVDLSAIRPLKVVVDAGNGMGGHTVPAVLGDAVLPPLPLDIVPLYFELDGSFPNHEANPLEPKNIVDLQKAVVAHGADIGLAFDGDADRCMVVDAEGKPVSPSAITALVAVRELAKHPGAAIIHNLITSRAVPEIIAEHGGKPVRTRVGHSFIKAEMARTGAVFGGEHSAHYFFQEFWGADTGMLVAMHVLAALGEQDRPLSELVAQYARYHASGEINSTVTDQKAKLTEVAEAFGEYEQDELDGLTITFPDGAWANLRPSNTEPLLRLNVEAASPERMAALRDDILAIVRG